MALGLALSLPVLIAALGCRPTSHPPFGHEPVELTGVEPVADLAKPVNVGHGELPQLALVHQVAGSEREVQLVRRYRLPPDSCCAGAVENAFARRRPRHMPRQNGDDAPAGQAAEQPHVVLQELAEQLTACVGDENDERHDGRARLKPDGQLVDKVTRRRGPALALPPTDVDAMGQFGERHAELGREQRDLVLFSGDPFRARMVKHVIQQHELSCDERRARVPPVPVVVLADRPVDARVMQVVHVTAVSTKGMAPGETTGN